MVVGSVFYCDAGLDNIVGSSTELVGGEDPASWIPQTPTDILSTSNSEPTSSVKEQAMKLVTYGAEGSCTGVSWAVTVGRRRVVYKPLDFVIQS